MGVQKTIRIALAGNPNSGKTTIFNSMTGSNQKVGNYAGVTVEMKEGRIRHGEYDLLVYDLPGIYSLTAYSIDEVVTRDFLLNDRPDIVIDVLDATNIERNLYLLLQLHELGVPVMGAVNIADQAESMGISISEKSISALLGIPMVKTVGTKGKGVHLLLDEAVKLFENGQSKRKEISYGDEIEQVMGAVAGLVGSDASFAGKFPPRWLAAKLIEKDEHAAEILKTHEFDDAVKSIVNKSIRFIETHYGRDAEIVMSEQRYGFIRGVVEECVKRRADIRTISQKIDIFLLNRVIGFPVFIFILWSIFQLTFTLSEYPMGWLESLFGWLSGTLSGVIPEGDLQSLVVDGVIGGVGGVMSFVPLVIILFAFISFLEDTGYMARAAFVMDKFLHVFGLHGQSFVPMMIGFGCSVPAVMAARTLKNRKDRIITVLVIPFMTCGAKLPVHVLLAAAFFPKNAGTMVMLMYGIGVALALMSALLFRKTVLKGDPTPFVMELPPYRMPTGKGVLWHVWNRTRQYIKKAGTILLPASILIWAITAYPKLDISDEAKAKLASELSSKVNIEEIRKNVAVLASADFKAEAIDGEEERAKAIAEHEDLITGKKKTADLVKEKADMENMKRVAVAVKERELEHSIAGRIGHGLETVMSPMGFDWKIGISAVTGFAAKEVVVSTLGILYRVGEEENEESESLRGALAADKAFTPLVALVLMLFTIIIAPCFASLAVIRAEVGWKWLGFSILYTTVLAFAVCTAVYQIGRLVV